MAQPENLQSPKVCGFHQYINFGKFKGQTFYDLANQDEYKYLIWCSNTFQNKRKGENWFSIAPSCKAHIEAALRTKYDVGKGKWEKKMDEQKDGLINVYYETQTGLQGPGITYMECMLCKKKKNKEMFPVDMVYRICTKCITNKKT